jgi:FkbM family methyltransferase
MALKRRSEFAAPEIGISFPIARGDITIDCGANIGTVTSRLARAGATVYAFEPNPVCFDILKRRFRASRKVHCIHAGVLDRAARMTFRCPGAYGKNDLLGASIEGSFEYNFSSHDPAIIHETVVDCIDLSEFIANFSRVRFLKLDIEGSEVALLNRLIDTRVIDIIDFVLAETHDWLMPHLKVPTAELRARLNKEGLGNKVCLDWY